MENGSLDVASFPFLMTFQNPLKIGTAILIEGVVQENASIFYINFGASIKCWFCFSSNKDLAFCLSPHFDRRCIIRNSTRKTKWGVEEIAGNMNFPLERGCKFLIEIFAAGKEFLIAVNGFHYCTFRLRTALSLINSLKIGGHCQLNCVSIKTDENTYPDPWTRKNNELAECVPVNYDPANENTLKVPLMCVLSKTLHSGDVIKIGGKVKLLPFSFVINLQTSELRWPHPSILLHINARYSYSQKPSKKNALVFNSWSNSKWGSEKVAHDGSLPMPGTPFKLSIICHDDHFEITSDEMETMKFPYRLPLQSATAIFIQGDVFVYSVSL